MKKHVIRYLALLSLFALLVMSAIAPMAASASAATVGDRINSVSPGNNVVIDGKYWTVLSKQGDYALLVIYGNDYGSSQFRADGGAATLGGNTLQAAMDKAYASTSEMKSIAVVPNLMLEGNAGVYINNAANPSARSGHTTTMAGTRTNGIFFGLSHYDIDRHSYDIPLSKIVGAKTSWWMRSWNLNVSGITNPTIYAMYVNPTHFHQYTTTNSTRVVAPAVWVKFKGHTTTTPPVTKYSVTYYPNGGTGSINTYNVNANTYHTVTSQNYTRSGYTFAGWNTRADGLGISYNNGASICVTGSISLYAQWKSSGPTTVSVIYYPNGGSGTINTYSAALNSYYTVTNQNYTRSGYTFNGWNTKSDGTGTSYNNGASIYVTSSVSLYAQWKSSAPTTVCVTYYPNGGTGTINTYNVALNSYHTVTNQNYTRSGYTFNGWNTRADGLGTSYNNGASILMSGNVSLYAQWKSSEPVKLSVIYYPNYGVGIIQTYMVPINTYHTALDQGYTRAGYTFDSWNTSSNGSGTSYKIGDEILVSSSVQLYAQWKPVATYTVTYDPGIGGTGGSFDAGLAEGQQYTVKTHTQADVSRATYNFRHWNTSADGSGTVIEAGETFAITSDITLYAIWIRIL